MPSENTDILLKDCLIQDRLMEEEYGKLTEEEFKQIYIEETGQKPPETINIYYSEDYVNESEANGFNGTIIHFYDKNREINEAYTIARGSEGMELTEGNWRLDDWAYNTMGILTGQDAKQYEALISFDKQVTDEILTNTKQDDQELVKFGLGHSLGGNLITTVELLTDRFKDVYTTNHAPPTPHQLAEISAEFREDLAIEFNIDPYDDLAIYDIDLEELNTFTEEYYRENGENIHHRYINNEMMHVLSELDIFIETGTSTAIEGVDNEELDGLHDLVKAIPNEVVSNIQLYLAKNYSEVYSENGFDGLFQIVTGIDAEVMDDVFRVLSVTGDDWASKDNLESLYSIVTSSPGIIAEMKEKMPRFQQQIQTLNTHLPTILAEFQELGYLTEKQKNLILEEAKIIEENTEIIEESSQKLSTWNIFATTNSLVTIYLSYQIIKDSLGRISEETKDIQEAFMKSAESHKLGAVISALGALKGREYTDSGVIVTGTSESGGKIKLNLTSAIQIYERGIALVEEQQATCDKIRELFESEYLNDFIKRRDNVVEKIENMEANPHDYQYLLGDYPPSAYRVYQIKRIEVDYDIPGDIGFQESFENLLEHLEMEVNKSLQTLGIIRETLEQFFEKEEEIANSIFQGA
ncbi:DUF6792 domain-containing protein [Oceanobacillus sp. J11TS1]|uniref:DUF6792 domain-containing protein n=1 Tax=Oceanobacillus sp. J11TS1 TaxID=2807191 RepID=UPI001B16180B|nr:DUF6792 domain-containing protein [Oceanobacillus sp. J11TS1]GIO23941.1 hypothetical protein J11TS1_25220 [Oceanobacillus sp. J11TS1]